jgi:hypothetical protein
MEVVLCRSGCVGFLWGSQCLDHDFIVPIFLGVEKFKCSCRSRLMREWE